MILENKLKSKLSECVCCFLIYGVIFLSTLISDGATQRRATQGRPAKQIGTYRNDPNLSANKAVDDDSNTFCLSDSGEDNIPAWWSVDLQYDCFIRRIDIFAPMSIDNCKYLETFVVSVKTLGGISQECASYSNATGLAPGVTITVHCDSEIVGREIVIIRNGGFQPRLLALAEIDVWGESYEVNRALVRSTTQSGTYADYYSWYAMDSEYYIKCALAYSIDRAWWQVDLGQAYKIMTVLITMETDIDIYRRIRPTHDTQYVHTVQYIDISVDNSNITSSNQICASHSNRVGNQVRLDCTQLYQGRYVTIRSQDLGISPQIIALCDVQVIGEQLINRAQNWGTTQSGTYANYISWYAVDSNPNSCAQAYSIDKAWWQVNLGYKYKILTVLITMGTNNTYIAQYVQDIDITVDNSNITSSNQICASYNNGSAVTPGVQLRLDCTQLYQGQYVTIRRQGLGFSPQNIALCDVQVIGEYLPLKSSSTVTDSTPDIEFIPSKSLSAGAVAGIVIAAVVVFSIATVTIIFIVLYFRKRNESKTQNGYIDVTLNTIDSSEAYNRRDGGQPSQGIPRTAELRMRTEQLNTQPASRPRQMAANVTSNNNNLAYQEDNQGTRDRGYEELKKTRPNRNNEEHKYAELQLRNNMN